MKIISYAWEPDIGPVFYLAVNGKQIGVCICHRRKDRSIPFFGLEKIFCSRCIGMLLGVIGGVSLIVIGQKIPLAIGVALCLPLIVDGFSQLLGYRESNNLIRLITGFLFGLVVACIWQLFSL